MLENLKICKECGGTCCKYGGGCIFHPNQFIEISNDSIISILKTGIVSIDFWWGNPVAEDPEADITYFAYYLRMRNNDEPIVTQKEIYLHQRCAIYNEKCPLELKYRPAEGAHLIPDENRKCHIDNHDFTKHGLAIAWLPYNQILTNIVESNKNDLNYEMHESSVNELKN